MLELVLLVLAALVNLILLILFVSAVVLKLPSLLERQVSLQQQTHQTLREILIEIRSVTKAE